jgi:prepilin-type N-terminal cleavage/methylation domain-containing protein
MSGERHHRIQQGFTLIEVVIALALLGLVLAALSQGLRGALIGNNKAGTLQTALSLAESRLAVLGTTAKLEPGTQSGTSGGLTWTASVEPYGEPQGAPDLPPLFRLRVKVTSPARMAGRDVTLETLRLGAP